MAATIDSNRMCRMCTKISNLSDVHALFDEINANMQHEFAKLIFTKFKISPCDELPQNVCNNCNDVMGIVKTFFEQCAASQVLLREVFKTETRPNIEIISIETIAKDVDFENIEKMIKDVVEEDGDDMERINLDCNIMEGDFEMSIKNDFDCSQLIRIEDFSNNIETQAITLPEINSEIYPSILQEEQTSKSEIIAEPLPEHPKSPNWVEKPKLNSNKFVCRVCNKEFERRKTMDTHMSWEHNISKHECPHCKEKFNETDKFKAHIKSHDSEGCHHCQFCDQIFPLSCILLSHEKQQHTEVRPHLCPVCGATFLHKSSLRIHARIHTGERPFKCDICPKDFVHRNTYEYHMKSHAGNLPRPFICERCGKDFSSESALKMHLRTHTGEKPFKCSRCESTFVQKSQLDIHEFTVHGVNHSLKMSAKLIALVPPVLVATDINEHQKLTTKKLPFTCTVCNKGFKLPNTLSTHFKMHSAVRPFQCSHCELSFKEKRCLKSHERDVHLKLKPYICQVCSKGFAQSGSLKLHMVTHSDEKPYKCPQCNRGFAIERIMKVHMRVHTKEKIYKCQICNEASFRSYDGLSSHVICKHKNWTTESPASVGAVQHQLTTTN